MEIKKVKKNCKKLTPFGEIGVGMFYTGISDEASLCQKLNNDIEGPNFINWHSKTRHSSRRDNEVVEVEIKLIEWHEKY